MPYPNSVRFPQAAQVAIAKASTLLPAYIGHVIFTQGHEDGYVHYLVDGSVELLRNGKSVEQRVAGTPAARHALDPPGRKLPTPRGASVAIRPSTAFIPATRLPP